MKITLLERAKSSKRGRNKQKQRKTTNKHKTKAKKALTAQTTAFLRTRHGLQTFLAI